MAQIQNGDYEKVPPEDVGDTKEELSYGYGVRHIQALIIFICLFIGYLNRAHLGVSIVAMTYTPTVHEHVENLTAANKYVDNTFYKTLNSNLNVSKIMTINNTMDLDEETVWAKNKLLNMSYNEKELNKSQNEIMNTEYDNIEHQLSELEIMTSDANGIYKKYLWSKPIQEMVLTSFYVGYCVSQYFMSMIAQRWGGKLPLQIGLIVNAVVSAITPWLAFWGGWQAVCVCRILQGMSQGGFYPSIQTLLAQWVPPKELARLSSFVYTGSVFGTIIAFQLGGILAVSPWGWPSIFWGAGLLCFIAFVLLTVYGAATPCEHKNISEEERRFITHTMTNVSKKKPKVPIKAILTSKPVWAIFTTHIGSSMAFLFIFMQVPSYIHYSLGVNVKNSGLFSSLPYVASFFASIFYGIFSDFLTNRNILTVKTARRTFNTLAQIGIALCLVGVSYTKSVSLAITLLVLAQTAYVAVHVGWMVNYLDLSSNFSGAILAMGNTLMNLFTLILPILVSYIITDVTNQIQWRVMFFLTAGFTIITNAAFVWFMSADRQPWDEPEFEKTDSDETVMEKIKAAA